MRGIESHPLFTIISSTYMHPTHPPTDVPIKLDYYGALVVSSESLSWKNDVKFATATHKLKSVPL